MNLRTLLAIFLAAASVGWNASSRAIAQDAAKANRGAEKPNYRYWTTDWSFKDIDLGNLVSRLKALGIDLPVKADGRASVEFKVSVPINALRTGKAYQISGSLNLRELIAGPVKFDRLDASVRYVDGRLELNQLRGFQSSDPAPVADAGNEPLPNVDGTATFQLIPRGRFEAAVQTNAFTAGPIADLLIQLGLLGKDQATQGRIDSELSLSAAMDDLSKPTRWSASGKLRASNLRRTDRVAVNLNAPMFRYKDSKLVIPELELRSATERSFYFTSGVQLGLHEQISFELTPQADDLPVTELLGWFVQDPESIFDGKLDLKGRARGSLQRNGVVNELDVRLAIASPEVEVAGIKLGTVEHDLRLTPERFSLKPRGELDPNSSKATIRSVEGEYQIGSDAIEVFRLEANVFGGRWTGSVSFSRSDQGTHRLQSKWHDLRPVIELPVGLTRPTLVLQSSGQVEWTVPADSIAKPSKHSGTIHAKIESIQMGDEPLGQADVRLSVDDGQLDGRLSGELLGGTVMVQSQCQHRRRTWLERSVWIDCRLPNSNLPSFQWKG